MELCGFSVNELKFSYSHLLVDTAVFIMEKASIFYHLVFLCRSLLAFTDQYVSYSPKMIENLQNLH